MGIDREMVRTAAIIAGALAGVMIVPATLAVVYFPEIHTVSTSVTGVLGTFGVVFTIMLAFIRISSSDEEDDEE